MSGMRLEIRLIEKPESHIIIFLLLRLFLLSRSCFSSRGSTTCSSRGGSSSRCRADTRPNSGDEGLQVTGLQSLGKESWPVRLNLDTGRLEDGGDLLRGDGNIIIGQDQGSVHAG